MRNILIIGGSKGIGNKILNYQVEKGNRCINISRNDCEISNSNLTQFNIDITRVLEKI